MDLSVCFGDVLSRMYVQVNKIDLLKNFRYHCTENKKIMGNSILDRGYMLDYVKDASQYQLFTINPNTSDYAQTFGFNPDCIIFDFWYFDYTNKYI